MEPEQRARQEIDRQLAACGWIVQGHKAMNPAAGPGIAVREFPLDTGPVDYLLYAGGKVIGIVEAKPPLPNPVRLACANQFLEAPSREGWCRRIRRTSQRANC